MISIFITFNHLSIDTGCAYVHFIRTTKTAMSHPYKTQLSTSHVKQLESKSKFKSNGILSISQCIYNQFFIAIFNYQMKLRTVLLRCTCTVVLFLFQCSCFKCCLFVLFLFSFSFLEWIQVWLCLKKFVKRNK